MEQHVKNVRISFPKLFNAESFAGDPTSKPAYSASFLLPPNHPQLKALKAAIVAVAKEKWAEKAPAMLKAIESKDASCLHDGNNKADTDGYAGNFYLSARSYTRPLVIDRDKTPLTEADGVIYGGCFVNVLVDIYAQDSQFGKRINAVLKGVQFLRDGDSFGGGAPASPDAFDDLSDQDDEEALA